MTAGAAHNLGLKADGTIVPWGWNEYGQCDVPTPNGNFTAVAAGEDHSLGLKSNGSLIAWGWNNHGQCDVPTPNGSFTAVAAGKDHSLGLKSDGSIVAWGDNDLGQCNVPSPNSGFVAVTAGGAHSLGLKSDGSIVAWGDNYFGQCNVPSPNSGFVAVAAGAYHCVGLKGGVTAVTLSAVTAEVGRNGVELRCSVLLDHPGRLQVLRADMFAGPYESVCEEAALAPGRTEFSCRDTTVQPASNYFYKIACAESGPWVYSLPIQVQTPGGSFALLDTGANPSRGGARGFRFALARAGDARLEIFDVAGRRLRTVTAGRYGAGVNQVAWDGCSDEGRLLPPGVYCVRLASGGRATSAKIVIAR